MSSFNYYRDNLSITTTTTTTITTTTINEVQSYETKPVPTKLYVTNFPQNCTRRQLTEFFSGFGKVLECAIMWDSYAFIHYGSHEEAYFALQQARSKRFMGNKLIIQLSTSKNRQDSNWYQREATKLHNQLFPMQSTPYSNETDKLILSCIDNLDIQNSSSKSSISSNSLINVTDTKLYVTNLPDDCNKDDLKLHFGKYGNVLECVIMWNHYAFIHYSNPKEARYALEQTHGKLYLDRNLIVQLSTSSNRPLPKCIALNKNGKKSSADESKFCFKKFELENSIIQQSGSFYDGFEKQNKKSEKHPPTILCYRASELENELKNKLNLNNSEYYATTLNTTDMILNGFEKHKHENRFDLSFSEIPTPELSNVPTKKCMPQINKQIKSEIDFLKELMNKKNDNNNLINTLKTQTMVTLDEIPTPPRPNKSCFQKLVDDIRMSQQNLPTNGSVYDISHQQECPKYELNETKTTLVNDKKCSRTSSSSSYSSEFSESSSVCSSSSSPYSTCEDSVYGTKPTKSDKAVDSNEKITKQPEQQENQKQQPPTNNNKLLRSRCRIINYLLNQENNA